MKPKTELEELRDLRDNDTEWLDRYRRTVVGLAAFAEIQAETCDEKWMGMHYMLEELADAMDEDIKGRKGGAE